MITNDYMSRPKRAHNGLYITHYADGGSDDELL